MLAVLRLISVHAEGGDHRIAQATALFAFIGIRSIPYGDSEDQLELVTRAICETLQIMLVVALRQALE
jgi:hypothetical protein